MGAKQPQPAPPGSKPEPPPPPPPKTELGNLLRTIAGKIGDNSDAIEGNAVSLMAMISEMHFELAELKKRIAKLETDRVVP